MGWLNYALYSLYWTRIELYLLLFHHNFLDITLQNFPGWCFHWDHERNLPLKHCKTEWETRRYKPFYRNCEWSSSSPNSDEADVGSLGSLLSPATVRFALAQTSGARTDFCFRLCASSGNHTALFALWATQPAPSSWFGFWGGVGGHACRCDLTHPPITSHCPIFLKFKNRTG